MKRIDPLYVGPWDPQQLTIAVNRLRQGDVAIVTGPNSGPPTTPEDRSHIQALIGLIRGKGASAIGYVPLGYDKAFSPPAVAGILEATTAWRILGTDGIFFDEATPAVSPGALSCYRNIHGNVRSWPFPGRKKALTVFNPGVEIPNELFKTLPGSVWVTFEGPFQSLFGSGDHRWDPPVAYRDRRAVLVHTVPPTLVTTVTNLLAFSQWGFGAVTADGADGNPWDGHRTP